MSAIGLLLVGATVALHVESVGSLSAEARQTALAELTQAIEARTRQRVAVDDDDTSCSVGEPCLSAIRSRNSTFDVVLVRLILGPLRLRITAHRQGPTPGDERYAEVDVKAGQRLGQAAGVIASALFSAPAASSALHGAPGDVSRTPTWIAWGTGAAFLGVGVGFALGNRSTLATLASTGGSDPAGALELASDARMQATVANVMFVAAVSAVAMGIVGWVLSP